MISKYEFYSAIPGIGNYSFCTYLNKMQSASRSHWVGKSVLLMHFDTDSSQGFPLPQFITGKNCALCFSLHFGHH